jgi:hypothetical protein
MTIRRIWGANGSESQDTNEGVFNWERLRPTQCHLLFCAEGATGAIAWGERYEAARNPRIEEQ